MPTEEDLFGNNKKMFKNTSLDKSRIIPYYFCVFFSQL